jgi:hypothetical protein
MRKLTFNDEQFNDEQLIAALKAAGASAELIEKGRVSFKFSNEEDAAKVFAVLKTFGGVVSCAN